MKDSLLIVPGYQGSDAAHWQQWLHQQYCGNSRILTGMNVDQPRLADWAQLIRQQIQSTDRRVWLVAHSFGCLAASVAIAGNTCVDKLAGVIMVAPASPDRFSVAGIRREQDEQRSDSIRPLLPTGSLNCFGVLIASRNDPWMTWPEAAGWAECWGLALYNAGNAGHINSASGYGAWPFLPQLLTAMQQAVGILPAGDLTTLSPVAHGKGSALARVRQATRRCLNTCE